MAEDTKQASGSIWHGPGKFQRPGEPMPVDLDRDPTILAGRAGVPLTGSVSAAGQRAGMLVNGESEARDNIVLGDGPDEAGASKADKKSGKK